MTTTIRFVENFYAVNGGGTSYVKYQAGSTYPADEETMRLAQSGIAEIVDVDEEPTSPPDVVQPGSMPSPVSGPS